MLFHDDDMLIEITHDDGFGLARPRRRPQVERATARAPPHSRSAKGPPELA